MKRRILLIGLLVVALAVPALAESEPAFDAGLASIMSKLDREASVEAEAPVRLAGLIQREFRTSEGELKWALENDLSWGAITAMAYIQATVGRSFSELRGVRGDWGSYVQTVGMNPDKMARSLEKFLAVVEKERNSQIFARLRSSRRVHVLPDLGSGFGLFQETMDFRSIGQPRTAKVHDGDVLLTKGDGVK